MNYKLLGYVLRYIILIEGILMLLPAAVSVYYKEKAGLAFLICIAICFILSFPLTLKKPKNTSLLIKEGFVAVALGWIVLSLIGMLPFMISGYITNPFDALFETVSGFTTTGASILTNIEILPKCLLFWRSFTHWIGGMGVLVFLLIILPMNGGTHMSLMKAESPGPSVDKLAPKVQTTAKILYSIYIFMTCLQIIILIIGKMPLFDAVTSTFGTAGTGGFGIKNDSIAGYNEFCQNVITVFMILFGINFNVYFLLLSGRVKKSLKNQELWVYLGIIIVSIIVIAANIAPNFNGNAAQAVHHSAFQVSSIITTTGYTTTDFNLWPPLSKAILVTLMFIGACAGSTGGGIKVSRLIILFKSIGKELHGMVHPNSVKKVTFNGKIVEHEIVRSTNVFMIAYTFIFALSVLFISFEGKDLVTNFTAVAATFNNIGPGLELVGPASNFSDFSNISKLILTFDMLAGRLEIFPMLILFYRNTWKKF